MPADSCHCRFLHRGAVITLVALAVLLALGVVVSSFRVGMADPVWPTAPWHVAGIDWSEPNAGFIVEHGHRLAGWIVGGCVSILAIGLWFTEKRPAIRWFGIAALLGLLAAFGQLHGVLIRQVQDGGPGARLTLPGPTAIALAGALLAVFLAVLATIAGRSPGRGLRVLGVLLLIGVMIQGLLGGLRVYLNALWGPEFSAVHGSFAQVVLALAVSVAVLTGRRNHHDQGARSISKWAWLTVCVFYAQIVAGTVLRHTNSPFGPRLHLLIAFVAVLALAAMIRQMKSSGVNGRPYFTAMVLGVLMALQIGLGLEAWLSRFSAESSLTHIVGIGMETWAPRFAGVSLPVHAQSVTIPDAALRSAHALIGYALFAGAIAIAVLVRPSRVVGEPRTPNPEPRCYAEALA